MPPTPPVPPAKKTDQETSDTERVATAIGELRRNQEEIEILRKEIEAEPTKYDPPLPK